MNKSRFLKKYLNSLFQFIGFSVVRTKNANAVDLRGREFDPREINYYVNMQPILIEAPIKLGRGLPIFSFSPDGSHPYVNAILKSLLNPHKKSEECIAEVLSKYYSLVQPINAASVLDLDYKDVLEFNSEPSWSAIMPWEKESLEEWRISHQNSVLMENNPYKKNLTISEGWAWVGPVSTNKLEVESQRLDKIFGSILENGYSRHNGSDGDILAVMLIDDNGGWCWQALTGQHRVSVLAGMEFKEVPVRIVKTVFRRDVSFWPQVKSGLYSEESALKVFDSVLSGSNPKIARQWENYIQGERL